MAVSLSIKNVPEEIAAALRERAISEERNITRAELTTAVEADLGCELPGSPFRPAPGPAH